MSHNQRRAIWGDVSLSALLAVQILETFVAVPLASLTPAARVLLDLGHLLFAAICSFVLTKRRLVRTALLGGLVMLAAGPFIAKSARSRLDLAPEAIHETIALTAFIFNALISTLVARRTFAPGRVSAYRLQGAILVYLNVAGLFAIAYGILETHVPGAIRATQSMTGHFLPTAPGERSAELSYLSLATITTTGYGDLVPVHPFARSMANLESVFGQLFPATVLARLVSLHVAHQSGEGKDKPSGEHGVTRS